MLYTPAPARGRLGHARAPPRRRAAAPDVPARGAHPRPGDRARPRRAHGRRRRRSPGPPTISYERLVVALGAVTRVVPVPGLAEHGRGFKDLADAIALRNHVLQRLEAAAAGGHARRARVRLRRRRATPGVEALAELQRPRARGVALLPVAARDAAALGPRGRRADDPGRHPPRPRRVRGAAARAARRSRSTSGETLTSYDGEHGRPLRRDDRPRAHARLDGRRQGLPAPRGVRPAARRAGPGARRRDAPGRGPRRRLGTRRLRRRSRTPGRRAQLDPPTCQHALRQARRLAKNLAGEPRALRLPDARAGRDARPLQGDRRRARAPPLGLPRVVRRADAITSTPSRSSAASSASSPTGRSSLFFRRDIAELSSLGHPDRASTREPVAEASVERGAERLPQRQHGREQVAVTERRARAPRRT